MYSLAVEKHPFKVLSFSEIDFRQHNNKMGITGLLQTLMGIQERRHLREYTGMVVAVDAYCWLHKGAWSSTTDIVYLKDTTK